MVSKFLGYQSILQVEIFVLQSIAKKMSLTAFSTEILFGLFYVRFLQIINITNTSRTLPKFALSARQEEGREPNTICVSYVYIRPV
jgi:hypothetical protein